MASRHQAVQYEVKFIPLTGDNKRNCKMGIKVNSSVNYCIHKWVTHARDKRGELLITPKLKEICVKEGTAKITKMIAKSIIL